MRPLAPQRFSSPQCLFIGICSRQFTAEKFHNHRLQRTGGVSSVLQGTRVDRTPPSGREDFPQFFAAPVLTVHLHHAQIRLPLVPFHPSSPLLGGAVPTSTHPSCLLEFSVWLGVANRRERIMCAPKGEVCRALIYDMVSEEDGTGEEKPSTCSVFKAMRA